MAPCGNKLTIYLYSITIVYLSVIPSTFQTSTLKECAGDTACYLSIRPHDQILKQYKEMYTGCQVVQNNLVISQLGPNDSVSFLADIQEVNGAVIVFGNRLKTLPLPSLRLIRGNVLYAARQAEPTVTTLQKAAAGKFQHHMGIGVRNSSSGEKGNEFENSTGFLENSNGFNYSSFISNDEDEVNRRQEGQPKSEGSKGSDPRCIDRDVLEIEGKGKIEKKAFSLYVASNEGLEYLVLSSLEAILDGGVAFEANRNGSLGHLERSINWKDIFHQNSYDKIKRGPAVLEHRGETTFECDSSCKPEVDGNITRSFCWGPRADMCQKSLSTKCHPLCAAGCTGRGDTDCLSCWRRKKRGQCVESCSSISTLNGETFLMDLPLAARSVCVDRCPDEMIELTDNKMCVMECPENYTDKRLSDGRIVCDKCPGSGCHRQRRCGPLLGALKLNGNNIKDLKNCTHFRGSLELLDTAFFGDAPLTEELLNILESIEEIYGYLYVDFGGDNNGSSMVAKNITSLSFLKNLTVIKGQTLYDAKYAVLVHHSSLENVGLQSLQYVYRGNVVFAKNKQLCYLEGFDNNNNIVSNRTLYNVVIRENKNPTDCEREDMTCSDMCLGGCWGPGPSMCVRCKKFRFRGTCQDECRKGLYAMSGERSKRSEIEEIERRGYNETNVECGECDVECEDGCFGQGPQNCTKCKRMIDNALRPPMCRATCPNDTYPKGKECMPCYGNCAAAQRNIWVVIGGIVVGVVALIVTVVSVCWIVKERRRKRREELVTKLTLVMEPNTEAADLSQLRLIVESELRRGTCIGSGAFGVVYKGVWIPTGENFKIPVAIKVLNETADETLHTELLEEARVMASVCHDNCIRIIAVCMGASLQLITPLMPAGCLLNYIRENKANVGSRSLLTWSSQIAKGMEYLERRGIVHRDLAARNVLVQSSTKVKITDFGLAKLLPEGSEKFQSGGEKMPIKWLAPESLLERVYTHKSDVWSFGVTLWEMYTYGGRPYENVAARDMVEALENGARLSQPEICTIDVYMILIKCWLLHPKSRPTFAELSQEFVKMTEDPGRFLVIKGDNFMRLQSRIHDTTELLRGTSGVELPDDPHQVISAEEYLNPTGPRHPIFGGSLGGLRGSRDLNTCFENGFSGVEPRKPTLPRRPFVEQQYIIQNPYQNDVDISSLMTPPTNGNITSRLQLIKEVESPSDDDIFNGSVRSNGKHSIHHGGEQQQYVQQRPIEDKYDEECYLKPFERPQESYLSIVDNDSSDSADAASPLLTGPETVC